MELERINERCGSALSLLRHPEIGEQSASVWICGVNLAAGRFGWRTSASQPSFQFSVFIIARKSLAGLVWPNFRIPLLLIFYYFKDKKLV
jgi:hypothetical protein